MQREQRCHQHKTCSIQGKHCLTLSFNSIQSRSLKWGLQLPDLSLLSSKIIKKRARSKDFQCESPCGLMMSDIVLPQILIQWFYGITSWIFLCFIAQSVQCNMHLLLHCFMDLERHTVGPSTLICDSLLRMKVESNPSNTFSHAQKCITKQTFHILQQSLFYMK